MVIKQIVAETGSGVFAIDSSGEAYILLKELGVHPGEDRYYWKKIEEEQK